MVPIYRNCMIYHDLTLQNDFLKLSEHNAAIRLAFSISVARPLVRCSTQFNEEYGCGLCLNPGKEVKKGHGHTRVYLLEGINAFDADWMHCVPLGVCRQFCNLWFSSSNKDQKYYFGSYLNNIDKLLLSYTPTIEISRTPRKMSDRVHWKAHEWVMFLLCYSLPTLKIFIPRKFLDHWALLVDGISILVQASILPSEII
ncbi:Protein of unknown function [Cotesia congregata]|uniref:Uncharacterized protein n=1 Tax=Cotesia congregata TaxID=51543 RepID=A0A8J2HPA2_COTCN|nr:Protein of unknown function [Cotesia congregata]